MIYLKRKTTIVLLILWHLLLGMFFMLSVAQSQSVFQFGALSKGNLLHYAKICFCDNDVPVGISTKNDWYRIKGFNPSGVVGWTYDPITAELTAGEEAEGVYMMIMSLSFKPITGIAAEYEITVTENGSPMPGCKMMDGFVPGFGSADNAARACTVAVQEGDVFSLDVRNITNTQDLTVINASVVAHRL